MNVLMDHENDFFIDIDHHRRSYLVLKISFHHWHTFSASDELSYFWELSAALKVLLILFAER